MRNFPKTKNTILNDQTSTGSRLKTKRNLAGLTRIVYEAVKSINNMLSAFGFTKDNKSECCHKEVECTPQLKCRPAWFFGESDLAVEFCKTSVVLKAQSRCMPALNPLHFRS